MFTRQELEGLAEQHKIASRGYRSILSEAILDVKLSADSPAATVFCSHSSKDKKLVYGLKIAMSKLGIELYVDWEDPDMPSVTSGETAKRLRNKIKSHDKFIVIVTDNSKDSFWVSWELGVADRAKKSKDVALWPVKERNKSFTPREYMELYRTIEKSENGDIRVYPPLSDSGGVLLKNWLIS